MDFPDGTPNGTKQVLLERVVNVSKMKAEEMRVTLQNMHDLKYKKQSRDTIVAHFIPKFHCELDHIEKVWAQRSTAEQTVTIRSRD